MELEQLSISKEKFLQVHHNNESNSRVVDYVLTLASLSSYNRGEVLSRVADRIKECSTIFGVDYYDKDNVKVVVRANHCKFKFCNNCKKIKQADRRFRFAPFLSSVTNFYHLILTVPNCSTSDLSSTLSRMSKSFYKFYSYLNGRLHPREFPYSLNVRGCLRSLEITFNNSTFHPHFHCGIVFEPPFFRAHVINRFSSDRHGVRSVYRFSDFEIFLQKLWRLCYEGFNYTQKNIDDLDVGFNVMLKKFKDHDFNELFKYLTKDDLSDFPFDIWRIIYESTFKKKQLVGFGCFHSISDDDIDDFYSEKFDDFCASLKFSDSPIRQFLSPLSLSSDSSLIISKNKFKNYLLGVLNAE